MCKVETQENKKHKNVHVIQQPINSNILHDIKA